MPNTSRSRPSKRYPVHTRRGRLQRRKRRGKRRRRRRNVRKMEVQYTSRTLTAYGFFYPMAVFLLEVLHLKEAFSSQISLAHQGKEFTVADFCITLVILPILGIERISHIDDKLKSEGILATMLGMTRFCSQKTLHGFLNRCSGWQVRQVDRINTNLIGVQVKAMEQTLDPRALRILDFDVSSAERHRWIYPIHRREKTRESQAGQEHQGQGERLLLVECGDVLWLYPSPDLG